jgi:Putative restriction endonuclease
MTVIQLQTARCDDPTRTRGLAGRRLLPRTGLGGWAGVRVRSAVPKGAAASRPEPEPRHRRTVAELFMPLRAHVAAHTMGEAFTGPVDIELSPGQHICPDVFVVPPRLAGHIRDWREISALLLAVDVLTSATPMTDRDRRRRAFQAERVLEYWALDLDSRIVERWRPDDERADVVDGTLCWAPRVDIPPLHIDLAGVFDAALAHIPTHTRGCAARGGAHDQFR